MRIYLDKIETVNKLNGLGLKRTISAEHYAEMYFDTELSCYVVIRKPDESDSKFSGKILIPQSSVGCAQISERSVPKHQPIGTPEERDTPSGKRKARTDATAKKAIAERAEARAASKKSTD